MHLRTMGGDEYVCQELIQIVYWVMDITICLLSFDEVNYGNLINQKRMQIGKIKFCSDFRYDTVSLY